MLRYLIMSWNPADSQGTRTADVLVRTLRSDPASRPSPAWRPVFCAGGLRVWLPSEQGDRAAKLTAFSCREGGGVILGTLFDRVEAAGLSTPGRARFDEHHARDIVNSQGRTLINRCWGNYLAVIHEAIRHRSWILRGPAGDLPCFHYRHDGVRVFFSDLEDGLQAVPRRFGIDWSSIARRVALGATPEGTALRGVAALPPGHAVETHQERLRKQRYWDPEDIAGKNVIENPADAAAALRDVVRSCVHAWCAPHRSVLHYLSGGLDSSIVLACLANAPSRPEVTCITEYSPGSDSDERAYARCAYSTSGGARHVHWLRNPHVPLEGLLRIRRAPLPYACHRRIEVAQREARLAQAVHARCVFTGSGGDAIFLQTGARLTAADFLSRQGFRLQLIRIAYANARLEGLSLYRVLAESLRLGRRDPREDFHEEVLAHRHLISTTARESVLDSWARPDKRRRLPPGKQLQLGMLPSCTGYEPLRIEGIPQMIAPLLSQPVIEIALRIPTYVLLADGRDRALARRAFDDELAAPIVFRRSKGGIEQHTRETVRSNLGFIRSMLPGGLLVQRGLLRQDRLLDALSPQQVWAPGGATEILQHLAIETWLRLNSPPTVAPAVDPEAPATYASAHTV